MKCTIINHLFNALPSSVDYKLEIIRCFCQESIPVDQSVVERCTALHRSKPRHGKLTGGKA